ncbi:MAG: SIMPL domain-containing protein [Cyanothece sp. SIO1E1]|nr:SIMPL domain-containing protein [Cyanothece sp. SIO1E1]
MAKIIFCFSPAVILTGLWSIFLSINSFESLAITPGPAHKHSDAESQAQDWTLISQANSPLTLEFPTDKRTMTVIGQGQAIAPADSALLEFRFASRQPFEPLEAIPLKAPIPAEELTIEELLDPIVSALIELGVSAEDIEIQSNPLENPQILVQLEQPNRERLQEVVATANQATDNINQLFLQSIGAEYRVEDCRVLERQSRQAALEDAESRSQDLAIDLEVEAGELLSVTEFPISGTPGAFTTCGAKVGDSPVPIFEPLETTLRPYNPSAPVEVQIKSQVSITYTIESGDS